MVQTRYSLRGLRGMFFGVTAIVLLALSVAVLVASAAAAFDFVEGPHYRSAAVGALVALAGITIGSLLVRLAIRQEGVQTRA